MCLNYCSVEYPGKINPLNRPGTERNGAHLWASNFTHTAVRENEHGIEKSRIFQANNNAGEAENYTKERKQSSPDIRVFHGRLKEMQDVSQVH